MEEPGSRPLKFEFSAEIGGRLIEWPVTHCIKCLCLYHPDDPADIKHVQQQKLLQLYQAARVVGRELLIEIIASKNGPMDKTTVSRAMDELYALNIKPDWWKLEPQADPAAWDEIGKVIDNRDPLCRGIVLLGLDAPEEELAKGFAAVADKKHVKGFAVGRTIFLEAAELWLGGKMTDAAAIDSMAAKYASLVKLWNEARA